MLFTQSNGTTNKGGEVGNKSQPIFIANNAIHEYTSQASINETIGLRQIADAQAASATAARARAELEIARRGLVSTVVALYYQVSAAEKKRGLFAQALQEANDFTSLTQKREAAREVAHADVIKAQLQQQQRQRDLSDSGVLADRARLELGFRASRRGRGKPPRVEQKSGDSQRPGGDARRQRRRPICKGCVPSGCRAELQLRH
jgi:outer membrane protein TolC